MSEKYIPIDEGDKAVLIMTAHLLSGKGYSIKEASSLFEHVMKNPEGIKYILGENSKQIEKNAIAVSRMMPPI